MSIRQRPPTQPKWSVRNISYNPQVCSFVPVFDMDSKDEAGISIHDEVAGKQSVRDDAVGTVRLYEADALVLIPTPSPDPRDPLNLPQWRKWLITITLGICAILTDVSASYGNDPRVEDLMTYPTLFMGIGNLIAMPVAMAVGRRPVFLGSALVLMIGSIWCATSTSLSSHIAGRDILSMAAGQSEALCPLIIQEIHFLHEKSAMLAWFSAIQSMGTAALLISTPYLVQSFGWKWWYGVFGIVNGGILILAFLFVPESRYQRPTDAFEGAVHIHRQGHNDRIMRATTYHGVVLDLVRFKPRSIWNDIKIFHGPADWNALVTCLVQMIQCLSFPNILWVVLMNSTVLGIYVIMVSEYAGILSAPPYNFAFTSLGYVQTGQIAMAVIMIPVLGYGGDLLTRKLAERRGGVAEPEDRLIPMVLPVVIVTISCLFFGRAGSHPNHWSYWTIIITYSAEYFGFISVVLLGYTYSLDSYPERAGPILVLICAVRGLISFGISFGVTRFITQLGYTRALDVCAIVMGVVGALGIPVYVFGRKIRLGTQKWAVDNQDLNVEQ
ncbi:putative synaptic vesicle transporter SVOP-2 [Coleophoma cylindrospora]|uniref:Putative synaptic vesicle transporter SVOP-2 n=1 Tax=Coleophoma cylindrospora TaxID=1849047 RepID=A0A3D8R736_9HELO|nr:putative synaptic vesicle transporter SVOP-2 [Coleophoma cylindrospora]